MKTAVTTLDPMVFEIIESDMNPPAQTEVMIRVKACGICGSDLHAYRDPSHWLSPDAGWKSGRVLGHEIAGEVVEQGAGVRRFEIGDHVTLQPRLFCGECAECRTGRTEICQQSNGLFGGELPGGFSEYLTVPQENLFRISDSVDFAVAALAEPLAVAVHGHRVAAQLDSTRPTYGERVLVLGSGPIGLMSTFYAKQSGASEVIATYRYPQQRDAALLLGATQVFHSEDEEGLESFCESVPVDSVIETVGGSADTAALACRLVRRGGRVVILGVFSRSVMIPAHVILSKQLRVAGTVFYSYVGFKHDYELAVELLENNTDRMSALITHRVSLQDAGNGIKLAGDKASGAIKVTIQP
jgi:L-iditol 2-dehydrogenase